MKPVLALISGVFSDGSDWMLSFEGLPIGWALAGFAALSAGTVFAYRKLTPVEPAWRSFSLIGLRLLFFALFFILLIKPVLNLTLTEPVRQTLLIAVDASQSMAANDKRERQEDQVRAGIATGALDPAGGLNQSPAAEVQLSRWQILQKIAANSRLNLWSRLADQAELAFFRFGREPIPAGEGNNRIAAEHLFASTQPDQTATAIGDTLRQLLQQERTRPVGAIFLITDGQNNAGLSPLDAARSAHDAGVPLFIYGVGITSPPDVILEEITTQKLSFVRERVTVQVRLRTQSLENQNITANLIVDGVQQDQQTLEITGDGEKTLDLHFTPTETGEAKVEVELEPHPREASRENNRATARLRVTDAKFHVLLIEQQPRWDFRYLLAYLQRDRRLEVRCAMLDGEPGLDRETVFLPGLPNDREEFFRSEVLILGDVNPDDLGEERMEIIREWVEAGGGIIFLSGPKFNPTAYAETPLAAVLPVVVDPSVGAQIFSQRSRQSFKLELTPDGASSPYLEMDPEPDENRAVWDRFPGVRWTAQVLRAKPNAEVLLTDSRPERANRYGPPPVFALQKYGAGTAVYLGTDETYRWRSGVGEKYYSILWGQIMQSLALELLEGGSTRTQLKTDRRQFVVGEKVVITGRAYDEGFSPLLAPTLEGTVKITSEGPQGETTEEPLNLSASSEVGFRAEFEAKIPGSYTFSTSRDPETVLHFEVVEPRLEQVQTALNERLLRAMAETTGGRFLREENLHELPELVREKSAMVSTFQRKELFYSPWWLVALIGLVSAEWFTRRISQLK